MDLEKGNVMGNSKRLLEESANRIQEYIIDYLENCKYDISELYDESEIDQISWDLAGDEYESAMEDKADLERDERLLHDINS